MFRHLPPTLLKYVYQPSTWIFVYSDKDVIKFGSHMLFKSNAFTNGDLNTPITLKNYSYYKTNIVCIRKV